MKRILLLAAMPLVWAFQATDGPTANMQRLTDQSNFVFQGAVTRLYASTEPQMPASASTAVVRVENLIAGGNMASGVEGKEITVLLANPRSLAAGRSVLFFSNVAIIGNSIAVKEVAHFDVSRDSKVPAQLAEYVKRKPERELQSRIVGAALIVSATVASVNRQDRKGPQGSEHDPDWTEAVLEIQATHKGAAQLRVTLWFPASDDISWFRSPKFQIGQSGVFLLRPARERGLQGFTALDRLDFHSIADVERIRQLIPRGRGR